MFYKAEPEPMIVVIVSILTISAFVTVGTILLSFYWDNILNSLFTGGYPNSGLILLFIFNLLFWKKCFSPLV